MRQGGRDGQQPDCNDTPAQGTEFHLNSSILRLIAARQKTPRSSQTWFPVGRKKERCPLSANFFSLRYFDPDQSASDDD
jgi:hypothetical protein